MKYRDPIIEVTGKMPFAGKHIAKYLFEKGKEGSENGDVLAKLGASAALGAFGFMHYSQLKMGITELSHAETSNVAEIAIDLGYTIANGMVVYTQTMLTGLALFTGRKKPIKESLDLSEETVYDQIYAGQTPSYQDSTYDQPYERDFGYSNADQEQKSSIKLGNLTFTEFAVTMGGQLLFLATKHSTHS